MKLPLAYYGNPVLRKKAAPVEKITDEIRTLIKNLLDTMQSYGGLGIAAPQVGKSVAIFIISPPIDEKDGHLIQAPPRVFINPKLTNPSQENWIHNEACLSIPKISGDVMRPLSVTVTAQDINGKEFTETFTEWPARVIMHENDHINGVLFIDRLTAQERKRIEPKLHAIKKQYNK